MNEGRLEGEERRRNLRAVMLPEQQGPVCDHSNASGLTHTAAESRQTYLGHGARGWMVGLTETLWRAQP